MNREKKPFYGEIGKILICDPQDADNDGSQKKE